MTSRAPAAREQPHGPLHITASTDLPSVEARLARILEGRDFPALSQQIADTLSALDDNASSIQRLTNVVLREYSLTLSVVRTANSAHYRRAERQIQSVTRAMVLLGARTVRQLAGSILLFENYRTKSAGLKELMLLSLLTANHAREVAVKLGLGDPEEAHLCGMCRNLGEVLIACHFPVEYARIHALVRARTHTEPNAMIAVLGFRYEALGVAVCRHWGMPESVMDGVRDGGASVPSALATTTSFAHDLTTVLYRSDSDVGEARKRLDALIASYSARLRLTRQQVREIVATSLEETRELFTSAKVTVDALRMRQLSDAACAALGITSFGDDSRMELPGAVDAVTPVDCRERLYRELESKVDPASECDLGQVLLLALEGALRGSPFDRVVACVLSPDRSRLRARSGLGTGVELLLAQFDFPMVADGGVLPALLLHRSTTYLPRTRAMTALELRLASKLGVAQFGVFPIIVDDQIVGCLYGDRLAPEPTPDDATMHFITSLVGLVVQAIDARRRRSATPPAREGSLAPMAADARELTSAEIAGFTPEMKAALVMRLLGGESLDAVAAASGVSPVHLEMWRSDFLAGAMARLATPPRST